MVKSKMNGLNVLTGPEGWNILAVENFAVVINSNHKNIAIFHEWSLIDLSPLYVDQCFGNLFLFFDLSYFMTRSVLII